MFACSGGSEYNIHIAKCLLVQVAARQAMTLLKNDKHTLPFQAGQGSVAVVGQAINDTCKWVLFEWEFGCVSVGKAGVVKQMHNDGPMTECCNVQMLNVQMCIAQMLNVQMRNVQMLNVQMLNVQMLNAQNAQCPNAQCPTQLQPNHAQETLPRDR